MSELLELTDVSKRYRRGTQEVVALREVSLRIAPGELVCVLGTRGQGKTTLLRIAAGMESADSGEVRFAGRELARLSDGELSRLLGSRIAWAGASGPGMPMRMLDYVAMPLLVGGRGGGRDGSGGWARRLVSGFGLRRERGRNAERRARAALERVGASNCAEARWEGISDWERALVEVAQAIADQPALLLVDDITDLLGLGETYELMELLRSLTGELGLSVLMSASDAQATLQADRICSLSAGRLSEVGEQGESPAEGVVIEFPGAEPARREAGHGMA